MNSTGSVHSICVAKFEPIKECMEPLEVSQSFFVKNVEYNSISPDEWFMPIMWTNSIL